MKPEVYLRLQKSLIKRRREIFDQITHLKEGCKAFEDRVIEPIDRAQKESLALLYQRLDKRAKEEIKEINLALDRMAAGTYGFCQLCGKSISPKRLKVLPSTPLCRKCARICEKSQEMWQNFREEIVPTELLDEYREPEAKSGLKEISNYLHDASLADFEEL